MTHILIQNARIVDPKNQFDQQTDLFIINQKIAAFGQAPNNFKAEQTIDAKSNHSQ